MERILLPHTLLDGLQAAPQDRPVTLLMRHSARYEILDDDTGDQVGLTPQGFAMAEELGAQLAQSRTPGRLLSSPVGRCVDTAASIALGAGWPASVSIEPQLAHPFMAPVWDRLIQGDGHLPCLPEPITRLVDLSLRQPGTGSAIDILVTHDSIIACMLHYLLGQPYRGAQYWPGFLEGLLFWQHAGDTVITWRAQQFVLAGA